MFFLQIVEITDHTSNCNVSVQFTPANVPSPKIMAPVFFSSQPNDLLCIIILQTNVIRRCFNAFLEPVTKTLCIRNDR